MDKLDDDNFLNENLLPKEKKVEFAAELENDKEKPTNNFEEIRKSKRSIRTVEKELTKEEKIKIIYEIPKESLTYIMTLVPQLLTNTISLIFLGHHDNTLLQLNCAQIGTALLNVLGVDFALGSMSSFDLMGGKAFSKDKSDLLKIYHEARIFCILIFLLLILPFGYSGDYILYFLGMNGEISETSGNYMKISLISILFTMFNQINIRLMYMNKMNMEVLLTNIFILGLHVVLCMIFISTFFMGALGAAVALVISNLMSFLISNYLLSSNNPFNGESFYMIDTNSLSSSKFYYYAVLGSKIGWFSAIRHLPRNFIILGSIYLNWIDFSSNCILQNYLSIFSYLIVGYGISLNKTIVDTLGESNKVRNYYIKIYAITGVAICSSISIMNFLFKSLISYIYIGEEFKVNGLSFKEELDNRVSYIVSLYSIFIFFDWVNNNSVAVLKAINKYKSTNLVACGMQVTIFLPLALLLSYTYGYGYAGLWYSIFLSSVLFSIINFNYLTELDMRKLCEIAFKERINYRRDDDEVN